MTIFAVLLPAPSDAFPQKIAEQFPDNFLKITDTQWLISGTGTALDISKKLGTTEGKPSPGIVFSMGGYFGRAPTNIWEWIKVKLESPPANG